MFVTWHAMTKGSTSVIFLAIFQRASWVLLVEKEREREKKASKYRQRHGASNSFSSLITKPCRRRFSNILRIPHVSRLSVLELFSILLRSVSFLFFFHFAWILFCENGNGRCYARAMNIQDKYTYFNG